MNKNNPFKIEIVEVKDGFIWTIRIFGMLTDKDGDVIYTTSDIFQSKQDCIDNIEFLKEAIEEEIKPKNVF